MIEFIRHSSPKIKLRFSSNPLLFNYKAKITETLPFTVDN